MADDVCGMCGDPMWCKCGGYGLTVSDYVLKCGRQADEIDKLQEKVQKQKETINGWMTANGPGGWIDNLRKDNDKLKEVVKYSLCISARQHGDDYAYDDCWEKMKDVLTAMKGIS